MAQPLGQVGRYELLEVIGRGGAAVVYLARQPDLDRLVALKELAAHHAADPSFAGRFVEESRLAAAMNNPSIVTVYEYFEHDGLPYIAMEYLSQGSLRRYLSDLTGAQLGGVLESVLEGLAYAERLGIVHRDLKPENLLVGANGRVKIADFGVARALTSTGPRMFQTVTGTPIGTPAYMSPEQALGETLTPATDLYSLGLVVWEALAGHPPFANSDTPMAVLYRQVHEPIPPIDTVREDMHPGASAWLSRMLAKKPQHRFPSAEAAWDELEGVLIDMLGARWRRDALLWVDGQGRDARLETLTPDPSLGSGSDASGTGLGRGVFSRLTERVDDDGEAEDRLAPEDGLRPQISAVLTPDPRHASVTPDPQQAPLTPDPQHAPDPRPAARELDPLVATFVPTRSRHVDDLDVPAVAAAASGPRWGRWVAAGVVILAGAGAGVAVGAGSSPAAPAAPAPVTTTTAASELALSVRPIMVSLARGRAAGMANFNQAKTLASQAATAQTLSQRYAAAAKKLSRLNSTGPSGGSHTALAALSADVTALSGAWHRVSVDATKNLRTQFTAEVKKIEAAQTRLVSAAAKVEAG